MADNPPSGDVSDEQPEQKSQPPRDNLIRMLPRVPEFRSVDGGPPTMFGHFAVFDQWTEINSSWEGRFMERIAPGAFNKTIKENARGMRVLFQHGQDHSIGEQVLGPIQELREDAEGAYFEVPLLPGVPELIVEGLRAGLYGTSFRFGVMKENFERRAKPSDHNPEGLPERTVLEARVSEFGPVTFPAYAGAGAGLRSMTDEYIVRKLIGDPELLRSLLAATNAAPESPPALSTERAEVTHSRREEPQQTVAAVPVQNRFETREEYLEWLRSKS